MNPAFYCRLIYPTHDNLSNRQLFIFRRWSKKYPICVTFRKEGIIENVDLNTGSDDETQKTDSEKEKLIYEQGEDEDEDDDEEPSKLGDKQKDVFADCRDADDDDEDQISKLRIYVFARTDRQKEDWYKLKIFLSEPTSHYDSYDAFFYEHDIIFILLMSVFPMFSHTPIQQA